MSKHVLVIGVGNMDRGDDGVGLMVARAVRVALAQPDVIEQSGDGATLMEAWQGAPAVVLVDAVDAGASPGTVWRIEAHAEPLPAQFASYTTHVFGVAQAIELARVLSALPPRLIVYGIQGRSFALGSTLSPPVRRAARAVVKRIVRDVRATRDLTDGSWPARRPLATPTPEDPASD